MMMATKTNIKGWIVTRVTHAPMQPNTFARKMLAVNGKALSIFSISKENRLMREPVDADPKKDIGAFSTLDVNALCTPRAPETVAKAKDIDRMTVNNEFNPANTIKQSLLVAVSSMVLPSASVLLAHFASHTSVPLRVICIRAILTSTIAIDG